ncbi:MAG TPA: FAD-dependent oxidoreductase [Candidatus Acidoferrales bacterium]|nr:FAD-dependent oxidoreductase [Candidatus Acidoferrales bacterium]
MHHRYVIIGGGIAAAAAARGIRAHDREGSVLLVSRENHLPYRRGPLAREAWQGGFDLERLSIQPPEFYTENRIEVRLRREIVEIDADHHVLWDERGDSLGFDHAVLATGSRPRRLRAVGSERSGVRYFRDLEDFLDLEHRMGHLQHVTIVGGGGVALELTTALRTIGREVTLVLPDEYPLRRVLPRELGETLLETLRRLDVEIVTGDTLVEIEEAGDVLHARTASGNSLDTQLVIVDQGTEPQLELGEAAGLETDDGVVVDELGRASKPGLWAAGDVAEFPYLALGQLMRVEGEDHSEHHGFAVGANMAGASTPYAHLPWRALAFGGLQLVAVGELDAQLDHQLAWLDPEREGVVYYLRDDVVRGVLMLNVADRLEWARALIREARPMSSADRAALLVPQA